MNGYIMLAVGVVLGALAGFIVAGNLHYRTERRLRAQVRALKAGTLETERKRMETMKKIVWVCLANGFAWIWCSYILAALDKVQIAESLSTAAVTEIVGTVLAYAIKSLVENLSKHNNWPDKRPVETPAEPEPENDTGEAEG